MRISRFWGKARPRQPDGPSWHPLVFHSLDVAAVGAAVLTSDICLTTRMGDLLGLPRDAAVSLLCRLLGLHDIGKFAKLFQKKVPDRYPDCFADDPAALPDGYDHGAGGLYLFDACPDALGLPVESHFRAWRPLVSAVMGHHGAPPEPAVSDSLATVRREFGGAGIEAARTFAGQIRDLLPLPECLPALDRRLVKPASYAVAGMAVLADWIGSNQDWFPYREPSSDLGAYWELARDLAEQAVAEAGVLPAASTRMALDYDTLLGGGAVRPSPMQEWALTVPLPPGPTLFVIEDQTGSGKTEAALMLAHRLLFAKRADGIYFALPTMATANAMFDRLAAACRHLFSPEAQPSVALAHGARDLHPSFRSATIRGGRRERGYTDLVGGEGEADTTASTACAEWIADDRRRTFLADAGAGTVDQALLSVLPSRHQSLRLLGLMRRVLILDEVHAYDAYMQRELETLLEFQAGLNGAAILLSATLPDVVRHRLTDAFSKGAGRTVRIAPRSAGYPLASMCTSSGRTSTPLSVREGLARTVPVRFLRSQDEALGEVELAAGAGRAVLYVCNTVDDALEAHAALRRRGLAPAIFHARFVLADRLRIERQVVRRFGRGSEGGGRRGSVLVATQVVEQSLDLDFDVMVTDLAPIDLLIQRAGRLWRHERDDRRGRLELIVVGPEPVADAAEDWFSRCFPRAAYVYRDHARLWLSARLLRDAGEIESPGGIRTLIEGVYGDGVRERIPPALRRRLRNADSRAGRDRGSANINVLKLAKGYLRDGGAWGSDARTPTRLADDPRVTLRLACVGRAGVRPYDSGTAPGDTQTAWRRSEVSVSARRVAGEVISPEHVAATRVAKAGWTRFDAEKILVILDPAGAGGMRAGWALGGGDEPTPVRLSYDRAVGLTWF